VARTADFRDYLECGLFITWGVSLNLHLLPHLMNWKNNGLPKKWRL